MGKIFILFIILHSLKISIKNPKVKSFKITYSTLKPKIIKTVSFGQERLLANLLWIKSLLIKENEVRIENHNKSHLLYNFLSIINLNPHFYNVYLFASTYLSVAKNDIHSSEIIFEKGLKIFPNDYNLNYFGGIHALLELKDTKKASKRFSVLKEQHSLPKHLERLLNNQLSRE